VFTSNFTENLPHTTKRWLGANDFKHFSYCVICSYVHGK